MAGRPRKQTERRDEQLCLRLTYSDLQKFKEIAAKNQMTVTDFVLNSALQKMREIESQNQNNVA